MLELQDLFADYTPPNAADYRPDALVSPKLWPGVTLGWAIAYNTQLVKNAPKTWMDLTKPEYKDKQIGQVVGPSGGTTWTRVMTAVEDAVNSECVTTRSRLRRLWRRP